MLMKARRVVNIIRNLTPPGRFLAPVRASDKNCKDQDGSILWRDVGDKKARAKASQCLREKKVDTPIIADSEPPKFDTSHHGEPRERKGSMNSFNAIKREEGHNVSHSFFPDLKFPCNQQSLTHCRHPSTGTPAPTQEETRHPFLDQMPPLDYFHKLPQVTPCDKDNQRSCTYFRPDYQYEVNYTNRQEPNPQSSELQQMTEQSSWIGSFCSLETQLVEESESMSLSPPRPTRTTSQQNAGNFPLLHAASWASSDVGSELTDNSHTEEFS